MFVVLALVSGFAAAGATVTWLDEVRGSVAVAISGVAAIVAMECGWIVTEVGRQPWIVQGVMRTEEAITGASGVWLTFSIVLLLYAALGTVTILVLRRMARRWREQGAEAVEVPYGPTGEAPAASGGGR